MGSPGGISKSIAPNHIFDTPSLLGCVPCVGRSFKVEHICDELFEWDGAGFEDIHGDLVIPGFVSECTMHMQLLFTHGDNGEVDDRFAESSLDAGASWTRTWR